MPLPDDCVHREARAREHGRGNVLAAALAVALATFGGSSQAATRVVTNCNDSGSGSLRAAITAAMSGDLVDASGLACSTISLSTGALAVTVNDLRVRGPGRESLTVSNGAKYGRVFRHEGTGVFNLYGMTISGGAVSPTAAEAGTEGGCIYSKGTVNLGDLFALDQASGVAVTDCVAISTQAGVTAQGGGVFARRGAGLANSTITGARVIAQDEARYSRGGAIATYNGNFAMKYSEVSECSASGPSADAGGVFAVGSQVTITHSSIVHNAALRNDGGAYLATTMGGLISIDNSTISGNTAEAGVGGAALNALASPTPGNIHIYSSTITQNESMSTFAVVPGGIFMQGPAVLKSSIFAANTRLGTDSDLRLSQSAGGSDNLVGSSVNFSPPAAGLITSTNPRLGPLANRGGPTRTHEPLADSLAIDHGNTGSGGSEDQRGFPRTLGARTDIGSVERNPDTIFASGFD